MEQKLRQEAKALLESGRVTRIVGHEAGSLKFATTPLITTEAEGAERLLINPFITNNLAVYLPGLKGKTGIAAKACDSRAIVSLVQDNQLAREDVIILGIPCRGVVDVAKIEHKLGRDRDEIDDITYEGDSVTVTIAGEKTNLAAAEALQDDCLACVSSAPAEYDIFIGEAVEHAHDQDLSRARIAELEAMTSDKRWAFWREHFSRCIRCYACRQVCPACFCERCFAEEAEPRWLNNAPHWQDNLMFQAIRVLHTAGRCVDCGECERACPAGIPLRSLTAKMDELVLEHFDYKAGTDISAEPLMTAYQTEESEELIR